VTGEGNGRGNSGVILMGLYEGEITGLQFQMADQKLDACKIQ